MTEASEPLPSAADALMKDIQGGLFDAEALAAQLPTLLTDALEAEDVDACDALLARAYRVSSELRRQVDHLRLVISNRQAAATPRRP